LAIEPFLVIANESIECRPTFHGLRETMAEVLMSIRHPAGATANFRSEYPSLSCKINVFCLPVALIGRPFRQGLANALDDFPGSVAAFACAFGRLARLVDLLACALALGARILAGSRRALRRIVFGRVLPEWIA
jgi:hypothetical protein